MSEKKEIKNQKWKKLIVILLSIFIVLIITNLINPFWFRFPKRLHDKQEMFQFVIDNREELEEIANGMMELYDEKGKVKSVLLNVSSYMRYHFHEADAFIRDYSIQHISIMDALKGNGKSVYFEFDNAPLLNESWGSSNYWGVYYNEKGEAEPWMSNVEVKKIGDEYIEEVQGLYEYRTENIVGNWYYYHCQWCR